MNVIIFDDNLTHLQRITDSIKQSGAIVNIVIGTDDENRIENYLLFNSVPALFVLDIVADKQTKGFQLCDKILLANKRNLILFITNYPNFIIYNSDYKLASICFILKNSKAFDLEIKKSLEICSKLLNDTNFYNIINKATGTTKIHYS